MRAHLQQTTTTALAKSDRMIDRLPVFSALAMLGVKDPLLGRLMGVSGEMVHYWATGKKPLNRVRRIALEFVAARLSGIIGAKYPLNSVYARRAKIIVEAAQSLAKLSVEELREETDGEYTAEEIERGYALGQRIIDRLEQQ
jgi:hypothetical protein